MKRNTLSMPFFACQMDRLRAQFGEKAYSAERCEIIYDEMKSLSEPAFQRVVSRLLGESRLTPLLPDFRAAAAIERERECAYEKKSYSRAFEKVVSSLHTDEEKQICRTIIRRMAGKVPDPEWNQFVEMVERTIPIEVESETYSSADVLQLSDHRRKAG